MSLRMAKFAFKLLSGEPFFFFLNAFVFVLQVKCEKYWPDVQKSLSFANLTVSNSNEEVFADFIIRDLWLSEEGSAGRENRRVIFTILI